MRVYTKYKAAKTKRKPPNHWGYAVLALLSLAAAVWLGRAYLSFPDSKIKSANTVPPPEPTRRAPQSLKTNNAPLPLAQAQPTGENRPAAPPSTNSPSNEKSDEPPPELMLPTQTILEAQIALAQEGISPGVIDGRLGSQSRAALRAFQKRERLPSTGILDKETRDRLRLHGPAFGNYVVTAADLGRLLPLGKTWLAKSEQARLDYENALELAAEKGQASPGLIKALNPGLDWTNLTAGTALKIPNAEARAIRTKAAFIEIHLGEKVLEAFDAQTNLLAHFPCSIARKVEKRPVGQLFVEKIALNPNYRFDPEIFPESAEAKMLRRPLLIAPGPNNPVGTAWIGLSRPGYGIHGTPEPQMVGRTESHGCFRLANWNAEYLAKLVSLGTRVLVEP